MFRKKKPVLNSFAPSEKLFIRVFRDQLDSAGHILPPQVAIPDQSVNRSGCDGKFWFVLMPEPHLDAQKNARQLCSGVYAIHEKDIPTPLVIDGAEFTFAVVHDPIDRNYQHCEIRVYRDGKHLSDKKYVKKVKKYYRTIIANAAGQKAVLTPESNLRSS